MGEPVDKISLGVEYFSVFSGVARPDATHGVGASHLREYLDLMCGGPMPQGEAERALADQYYAALGALSIDDVIHDPGAGVYKIIARRAKLLEIFVGVTNAIGEHVDSALQAPESPPNTEIGSTAPLGDFVFMLGLHDIGSFVVAGMLELRHPRLDDANLVARTESVMPQGHALQRNPQEGEPNGIEAIIALGLVGGGMQRRLQKILDGGVAIIERSTVHYDLIRRVIDGDS